MLNATLLLPAFKRAKLLELGLYSIQKNKPCYNLEIIVLNDGIEDDTEEVCKKFPDLNVRYIFTGMRNTPIIKKRPPSFALNIGIKEATGDAIILSCPEVFHLNNAFNIVLSKLEQNIDSLVIPDFLYFDQNQITTNRLLEDKTTQIDVSTLVGKPFGACHVEMPFLMALYKYHVIEIGGYDEDMTGYAGEDCDLMERLKQKGLTYLRTDAEAIHLWHEGTNDGTAHWDNPAWVHNYNILTSRRGVINRNVGREWGVNV